MDAQPCLYRKAIWPRPSAAFQLAISVFYSFTPGTRLCITIVSRSTLLVGGRLEKRQSAMRPAEECRVFIRDHHVGYINWATYEENQRMIRRNSVNWEGDESMAAIRAGQGLLVGLLRCGHCGRKLHVRYWGGRGTHARYLCKGD